MSAKSRIENRFEHGLFAARWLMAPMYLGLAVALAMLLVMFLREILYYAPQVMTLESEEVILAVLTLIDLSLAGNLLLIVLFSGYENFVSKFDLDARARAAGLDGHRRLLRPQDEARRLDRGDLGDQPAQVVHGGRRIRARHPDRRAQAPLDGRSST